MSIGFVHDRSSRQRKLTDKKKQKAKYHVKILLCDDLGFTEDQEEAICDLGYKVILTRNGNKADFNPTGSAEAARDTKNVIGNIDWCVPHFTLCVEQEAIISKKI